MKKGYRGRIYKQEELESILDGVLSKWSSSDGRLKRTFKTSGWRVTLMVANAIGHLSEVAWHHPQLVITYDELQILLNTHDANGITDRDLALAEKIEQFVDWSPGADADSRLPGLPEDSGLDYILR